MKVYLVEDVGNSPGRIYAVLSNPEDALTFAEQLDGEAAVIERTLFYGQPPVRGYNP